MLFHLTRYFITEVLRVFILTAAVLTTVIAFGAAIKPLAQDDLFSAWQILRYVLAAMVPMLQYAIPVAAAFAVTLVIHRMASDNEFVAAAVSGISYGRMLRPIVALGLGLVLVMSLFTHFITPQFLRLLERMISHDVTLLFQTAIARDQSFQVGNLQIYADDLKIIHNPPDSDAETRMVLSRMAAAETDRTGRVTLDVTARQGVVDVFRVDDRTYLKLALLDTIVYDAKQGGMASMEIIQPERALALPTAFKDSMDTKTTPQMFAIKRHPDLYSPIVLMKEKLADALQEEELTQAIRTQLAATGELRFMDASSVFVVHAATIAGGTLHGPDGASVQITQIDGGVKTYQFFAASVRVSRSESALLEKPKLDLALGRHEVLDVATGNRNERADRTITNVALEGLPEEAVRDRSARDLLALAQPYVKMQTPGDTPVKQAARALSRRLGDLSSDVIGRTAQRIALSVTVLLYALAGMILSMLMRGSPPLLIYSIVFAPAILCMMLIFGGTEVMRDSQLVTGSIIMWSGHVVILGMCIEGFRRLIRN